MNCSMHKAVPRTPKLTNSLARVAVGYTKNCTQSLFVEGMVQVYLW